MNIVVISASMRAESQSLKVASWLADHVKTMGVEPVVLDLHKQKLPLFDNGETTTENAADILALLATADGYVFVSPEWNGMMSHGLINMLHYVAKEMAYKPVMLVGVSAGRGGTHPIDQMRLMGVKNRHYIISPENLVVSGVEHAFNSPEQDEQASDYALKSRASYSLKVLVALAQALEPVRNGAVLDFKRFANGV